jgi:hypothetical protein
MTDVCLLVGTPSLICVDLRGNALSDMSLAVCIPEVRAARNGTRARRYLPKQRQRGTTGLCYWSCYLLLP